jgi:hypothetical protein
MLVIIIGVIVGIMLFLCSYLGFRTGLRLGMKVSNGTPPEPIRTPVQVIKDYQENKETAKANKELQSEIDLIMNYNGDVPKDG